MQAAKLRLKNFRNYEELEISLSKGVNILMGSNAQGKTNLLEALFYCATGRSHRGAKDKEVVRDTASEALINLTFLSQKENLKETQEKIEMLLRKSGRKSLMINDYPVRRINDLFGRFQVVMFSPEDLSIVKDGPSVRRKFMDMEICQVDPVYLYNLQQFTKVLRQRNQLLKSLQKGQEDEALLRETLFAWNGQLALFGTKIMERRARFVEELEKDAVMIHAHLTAGKEQLHLLYKPGFVSPLSQEAFIRALEGGVERDIRAGMTVLGPQHDDMRLFINDKDVSIYGSQGQTRTAALTLKLSEMEIMKREMREAPVLLLDDVMSELDADRQQELTGYIKSHQTLITCTGIEDSIKKLGAERIFRVSQGIVEAGR